MAANNTITLRGSTEIVTEFFEYSVNNILYQRGVYAPETFKRVPKYGLSMVLTTDEGLCAYMVNIVKQLDLWLMNGSVQKLILVVKGVDSGDTLERWAFNVEVTDRENMAFNVAPATKSIKEITQEIQAIMRQITASVTFLPLLSEPCQFDLLVYADKEATVPVTWEDSDPCIIQQAEEVKLRSFSTKMHQVDLSVQYKVDADGI
jgi:mitotic spindle assembly checkpoint protein MAD2